MSGTILLSKQHTFDVRTVDFNLIVSGLRCKVGESEIGKKLLETVDEFGMNMICVDEFDANELKVFGDFLREFGEHQRTENKGLSEFIEMVCAQIDIDGR